VVPQVTPRGINLIRLGTNQPDRFRRRAATSPWSGSPSIRMGESLRRPRCPRNGSIRLEAAGGAGNLISGVAPKITVASTQGGTLTIGPQSQMEILPELSSSATEVPAQTQLQSSVTLLGEQVLVQGGSIVAPGGNLTAIAAANPSAAAANPAGGVASNGNPMPGCESIRARRSIYPAASRACRLPRTWWRHSCAQPSSRTIRLSATDRCTV